MSIDNIFDVLFFIRQVLYTLCIRLVNL